MKKMLLSIALITFSITATAQEMAKQQAESLTAHLNLNTTQKEAVYQLYKTAEEKQSQERKAVVASNKPSEKSRIAREKNEKSRKPRPEKKPSMKPAKGKSLTSSERFTLIAHKQAESNPSLLSEIKKILTKQQHGKWQAIGKK